MPNLPEIQTILYATDLGKNTRPVFKTALSLATKFDAGIIMLHVVEPMSSAMQAIVDTYMPEGEAEKVYKDGMKSVLSEMKKRLKDFTEDELETPKVAAGLVKEILVVSGRVSEEILKAAVKHDADIIVMGKSSRSVMGSEVAGSSTRRVTRHTQIPVLIVPNTPSH
jgi:nucleotide-binding universal stress UspA family protein